MSSIRLTVKGKTYNIDAEAQTTLLSVLRDQLDLTGSKYGCGGGQCGACTACTVLIDGKGQRSCITKVGAVSQKQITTIEGLASGEQLHPVQAAFLEAGGLAPAIANAIFDASDVRLRSLPLVPNGLKMKLDPLQT